MPTRPSTLRSPARDVSIRVLLVGLVLTLVLALGSALVAPTTVEAHTPHDTARDIAMSPTYADDLVVYTTSQNRLLRSTDGGATWATLVTGIPTDKLRQVAIPSSDGNRIYVSSGTGVFRSDDGGDTWTTISSGLPNTDTSIIEVSPDDPDTAIVATTSGRGFRTSDAGEQWEPAGVSIGAVRFGPAGSDLVLAGSSSGPVNLSEDAGQTWRPIEVPGSGGTGAVAVDHDGTTSVLMVGRSDGSLHLSDDLGETFSDISNGLPTDQGIAGIVTSPSFADDDMIWVSTDVDGVYFSADRGQSWELRDEGLTVDRQSGEIGVADFYNLDIGTGPEGEHVLFLAAFDGPFRSDDGGETWTSLQTLSEMIVGLDVSPAYADDATIALATYVKGAFVSTDAGATFVAANSGIERELSDGNKLLPVLRLHNIVFSPDYANDSTIFSASWTRLLRSEDGGATWQENFVSEPTGSRLRQFVIGVSPAFADDGTIFLGTRQGEIYRSTERGDSESFEMLGSPGDRVRTIELHPDFPDVPTLFVSTDSAVMRSDDGGATWTDTGGPTTTSLLAISPDYANDQTVFAGSTEGLLITRDGGDTWQPADDPDLAENRIEGVETSPSYVEDQFLLVSVRGKGLYESVDGGETFQPTGSDLLSDNLLLADFSNPTAEPIHFSPDFATDRTVFGYSGATLLKSSDGGTSWDPLAVPPAAEFVLDVSPEPSATTPPGTTLVDEDVNQLPPADDDGDDDGPSAAMVIGVGALVVLAVVGAAFAWRRSRPDDEVAHS
ncbi:MAG: WD40/YVTN/BNR-like repeat-containing protein [Acidimicrobiales bacterium]